MRVYVGGDEYDGMTVEPDPVMWEDSGSDYEVPDELVARFQAAEVEAEAAEKAILAHLGFDSMRAFKLARMARYEAS